MELELAKTDEGQDRLGKAKDRLDTRTAEIGQQILEETSGSVQPEGEIQPPNSQGERYRWKPILPERNGE